MRVVLCGKFVQRVQNLFFGVPLGKFKVRLPAQLQPAVVVRPIPVAHARQTPLVASTAVLVPLAVYISIVPWTLFTHEILPPILRRAMRRPEMRGQYSKRRG